MSVRKDPAAENQQQPRISSLKVIWLCMILIFIFIAVWTVLPEPGIHTMKWAIFALSITGIILLFYILRREKHIHFTRVEDSHMHSQIVDSLFQFSPFPLAVLGTDGGFVEVNESTYVLLGYKREELLGTPFLPLIEPESREEIKELFDLTLQGQVQQTLMSILHKTGYAIDIHVTSIPLVRNGIANGMMIVSQDMSDRKRHSERIRYMAYYDDMTGLPNRRMFMNRLAEAMICSKEDSRMLAIMYLDVDRFKLVNDSFGRDFGDMLLLQVAERLTRGMEEHDIVARMEGDEFAVLYTGVSSEEDVLTKARTLQTILEEPFELQGFPFNLSASIGIAINSVIKDDPGLLVKMADMALGRVKDNGKNDFLVYSDDWNNSSLERLTLHHEMRQALLRNEFLLYYQPQYHMITGKMVGMEALVRWQHPERGMVSPGQFIPIAEESGLIVQLGDWVLEEACRQNKMWQEQGLLAIPVSVNLSIRQFMQQNLAQKIADILDSTGLEPRYLDLEITESMTMDVAYASSCLMELTKLGVGISIDDFGTGYSSFHYLKNFPINRLKIDQSFVRDIQQDPGDAAIVAAIIAMAHNLNLYVIAEGVETQGQMDFLKKHNCDEIQGYYWSPPVPGERIAELMRRA